jgi:hypothetical protein
VGSCWLPGARSTLFADLHLLLQFALLLQNSEGPHSVRLFKYAFSCLIFLNFLESVLLLPETIENF